ncbi:MAG: glutathione S-transferase N-terminal domain-containing protein, partial [Pseudomonadota bacterium]
MLRVYAIPVSLYCAKLRILLRHKGLAWEEVAPPGGYGSAAYKDHVPSGNLPALLDGDLLIADSEAIAEYLEERHPDPPMLPGDAPSR